MFWKLEGGEGRGGEGGGEEEGLKGKKTNEICGGPRMVEPKAIGNGKSQIKTKEGAGRR